jgi:hypothetical protein
MNPTEVIKRVQAALDHIESDRADGRERAADELYALLAHARADEAAIPRQEALPL